MDTYKLHIDSVSNYTELDCLRKWTFIIPPSTYGIKSLKLRINSDTNVFLDKLSDYFIDLVHSDKSNYVYYQRLTNILVMNLIRREKCKVKNDMIIIPLTFWITNDDYQANRALCTDIKLDLVYIPSCNEPHNMLNKLSFNCQLIVKYLPLEIPKISDMSEYYVISSPRYWDSDEPDVKVIIVSNLGDQQLLSVSYTITSHGISCDVTSNNIIKKTMFDNDIYIILINQNYSSPKDIISDLLQSSKYNVTNIQINTQSCKQSSYNIISVLCCMVMRVNEHTKLYTISHE